MDVKKKHSQILPNRAMIHPRNPSKEGWSTGRMPLTCYCIAQRTAKNKMAYESPEIDLIRLLIAEIWLGISMKAARELYGRSYFSLGVMEKFALDQSLATIVAGHYCALTPQFAKSRPRQVAGFQPESAARQFE
jgi:hypothetical protein